MMHKFIFLNTVTLATPVSNRPILSCTLKIYLMIYLQKVRVTIGVRSTSQS